MEGFGGSAAVRIVLPIGLLRQLCTKAQREWGSDAVQQIDPGRTRVVYCLGGRSFYRNLGTRPAGGFLIRWQVPTPSSGTIDRIGWDVTQDGSVAEVLEVIDALVGWPAASRAVAETPRRR